MRHALKEHAVSTAFQLGWNELDNGNLLAAAEAEFDVLVTTDQNLRYQQRLAGRRLAILILPTTSWPSLRPHETEIATAVNALRPGDIVKIEIEVKE